MRKHKRNRNLIFEMSSTKKEYKKPQKYVPGINDPILPPQLAEFQDKSTDEVLTELNRMPFFMTKLDNSDGDGGENVELEALKALAYEGEPHEIAENFKKQGNDLYKVKRFRDARELYSKGIDVKCQVNTINESLYANRAACELEIKNYRRCINDCKRALQLNPKNIKCYYRIAKAFTALERLDEALESIEFGEKIDNTNKSLKNLKLHIETKQLEIEARRLKLENEKKERENYQFILNSAIELRNITNIKTSKPAELLREASIKLENPLELESQLIIPAVVLFPLSDEFDFIAEVGELSTVQDVIDILMERPPEWFERPEHKGYSSKSLLAFMETEGGGLVKAGKKLTFHDILRKEKPNVPLFDSALKVFLVPKDQSDDWLSKWDKEKALARR